MTAAQASTACRAASVASVTSPATLGLATVMAMPARMGVKQISPTIRVTAAPAGATASVGPGVRASTAAMGTAVPIRGPAGSAARTDKLSRESAPTNVNIDVGFSVRKPATKRSTTPAASKRCASSLQRARCALEQPQLEAFRAVYNRIPSQHRSHERSCDSGA